MMTVAERIARVFRTRLGSRPGNPTYGNRLYLLRDKRADGESAVWFAKFAHEDVVRSEPTVVVTEARLTAIEGSKVFGRIVVGDGSDIAVEAQL